MEDYISVLINRRSNLINTIKLREKELRENKTQLKITENKINEYWRNKNDNSKIK